MNFKSNEKAAEVFEAINGLVLGQKAIILEFSASKKLKTN